MSYKAGSPWTKSANSPSQSASSAILIPFVTETGTTKNIPATEIPDHEFSPEDRARTFKLRDPHLNDIVWNSMLSIAGAKNTQSNIAPPTQEPKRDQDMSMSREEIDAKLERTEARIEATEARIEARLESAINAMRASNAEIAASVNVLATEIRTEFKSVPRTASMIMTAASTAIVIIGTLLTVLAFGGDRFDGGVQLSSVSLESAMQAKDISKKNTDDIGALNQSIVNLLNEVRKLEAKSNDRPALPQQGG